MTSMIYNKTCLTCGTEFDTETKLKVYCSKKCQPNQIKTTACRSVLAKAGLATGTVGAIAELVVSVDLMKKGFEVYRALSQASSCDILALKNGKVYTFEIRTGQRSYNGVLTFSNQRIRGEYTAVVVHNTNEIIYMPDNFH